MGSSELTGRSAFSSSGCGTEAFGSWTRGPLEHSCLLPPSVSIRKTTASQQDRVLCDLVQKNTRSGGDWNILESVHSRLQGPAQALLSALWRGEDPT